MTRKPHHSADDGAGSVAIARIGYFPALRMLGETWLHEHDLELEARILVLPGIIGPVTMSYDVMVVEVAPGGAALRLLRSVMGSALEPVADTSIGYIRLATAGGVARGTDVEAWRRAVHASEVAACRMVASTGVAYTDLVWWSRNAEKLARIEVWSPQIQDDDHAIEQIGCHAFVARLADGSCRPPR